MASRAIQAKILKNKRRGRFARFSGDTTKAVEKQVSGGRFEGEDKTEVKTLRVYVGLESFSKQVVNTGRSPNSERMQQYYNSVESLKEGRNLPEDFGIKDPRYRQVMRNDVKLNYFNIYVVEEERLDLHFRGTKEWFFVIEDRTNKIIKKSRTYGSRSMAMMSRQRITWVEQIPMM